MKDLKELLIGAIIASVVTLVFNAFVDSLIVAITGGIFTAAFIYIGGGFWYLTMKLKPKNVSEDNFMLFIYLGLPVIWMVWMYLKFN
jgi:hypothetical protein